MAHTRQLTGTFCDVCGWRRQKMLMMKAIEAAQAGHEGFHRVKFAHMPNIGMYAPPADAYVSGMNHTAYVSTTLKSPKARTSSSGWRYASSSVRADVSLSWDGTDLGSYVETSNHKFYCDRARSFFVLANTQASKDVVPPSLACENKTRGQTATCTVTDGLGIWSVSNWEYKDGVTNTVTVSEPTRTQKTWLGIVVRTGTVSVRATGPDTRTLTSALSVTSRAGWAFAAVSPQKVANGGGTGDCASILVTLVQPPPDFNNLGKSCLYQAWSHNPAQVSAGPNNGYFYVSSVSNSNAPHVTVYQWERNPDLENTSSTFYQNQTGTNGCLSGANLATQTQRHEIGSVQGHWGEYNTAQNNTANNLGVVAEGQVGVPSTGSIQFNANVSTALNSAAQTIQNAFSVQPYGANYDASGYFLGNVNWRPSYSSCQ